MEQTTQKKPNILVNGAETGTWPDGGTTPYHGEKGTTWEGGFRVPALVRWPGVIKPGTIINDIMSQEDWLPTLLAATGEPGHRGEAEERLRRALRRVPAIDEGGFR